MTYRVTLFQLTYKRDKATGRQYLDKKQATGRAYFTDLSRPGSIDEIGQAAARKLRVPADAFKCERLASGFPELSAQDWQELAGLHSTPHAGKWEHCISGTV